MMEEIAVKPMLDDLELPLVQEIATYDKRMLAEHKPPGMEGSLLQNMGRRPERIILWGVAAGTDALKFVEKLEDKFKAGKPVPFTTDITADSKIDNVIIEDLSWQELAGKPERYAYVLSLLEFISPLQPDTDTASVDAAAAQDAKDNQTETQNQIAANQGTIEVTVESDDPNLDLNQFNVQIEGRTDDGKDYKAVIDKPEEGVFRKTDVPPGQYNVSLHTVE